MVSAFCVALTLVVGAYAIIARFYPWILGRGKRFRLGLYPLSGDPVTLGHRAIIRDAARMCNELVVVIGVNHDKKYLFSALERVGFIQRLIEEEGLANVSVLSDAGLQTDLASKMCCDAIFRGVRNRKDEEFERDQALLSALFRPGFEKLIHFLPARRKWRDVSSTLVRGYAAFGVYVGHWTSPFVHRALVAKLGWWRVRLSASPGAFQQTAHLAIVLVAALRQRGINAHHIDFSDLQRELCLESSPAGVKLRAWITKTFGEDALTKDGDLNLKAISTRMLRSSCCYREPRNELDARLSAGVARLYRERLRAHKGVIILTWDPDTHPESGGIDTAIMLHEELYREPSVIDDTCVQKLTDDLLKSVPESFLAGAQIPKPAPIT